MLPGTPPWVVSGRRVQMAQQQVWREAGAFRYVRLMGCVALTSVCASADIPNRALQLGGG
jgi:hypothetical protein